MLSLQNRKNNATHYVCGNLYILRVRLNCQSNTNVTVEVCNVVIKRTSGLTVTMTCVGPLDMFFVC